MKSGKQRRAELDAKKKERATKQEAKQAEAARIASERKAATGTGVNAKALAPNNSYSNPDLVKRDYYVDLQFTCIDCGKDEVWKATQQKWWYEVAKGDVWTVARRRRACRRRERERRAEARRVHLDGVGEQIAAE